MSKKRTVPELTKERWTYLKQDLLAVNGTNRVVCTGKTYNVGKNKAKRLNKIESQKARREELQTLIEILPMFYNSKNTK